MTMYVTPKQRAECARRAMELLQQMRPSWVAYVTSVVEGSIRGSPGDDEAALGALEEATAEDALFWHLPVLRSALTLRSPALALQRRLRQAINRRAYLVESSLVVPVKAYLLEQAIKEGEDLGRRMLSDVDLHRILMTATPARLLEASTRIGDLLASATAEKEEVCHE